jgi:hypothetical protein
MRINFETRITKIEKVMEKFLNPFIDDVVIFVNKNKSESVNKKIEATEEVLRSKINRDSLCLLIISGLDRI